MGRRKLGLSNDGSGELFDTGPDMAMAAALDELEKRNKKLDLECNRLRVESVCGGRAPSWGLGWG